jgi:hypothetical protein
MKNSFFAKVGSVILGVINLIFSVLIVEKIMDSPTLLPNLGRITSLNLKEFSEIFFVFLLIFAIGWESYAIASQLIKTRFLKELKNNQSGPLREMFIKLNSRILLFLGFAIVLVSLCAWTWKGIFLSFYVIAMGYLPILVVGGAGSILFLLFGPFFVKDNV